MIKHVLFVFGQLFLGCVEQRAKQKLALSEASILYEKELLTSESEVKEATLGQLSSKLHDNIGQLLTLMSLQIERGKLMQPGCLTILNPLSTNLGEIIQQVRQLSHSLNTDYIMQNGLQKLLKIELSRLQLITTHEICYQNMGSGTISLAFCI